MNPNPPTVEQPPVSSGYIPGVGPHRPPDIAPAPKDNPTQTAGVTNETEAGGPAGSPPLKDPDNLSAPEPARQAPNTFKPAEPSPNQIKLPEAWPDSFSEPEAILPDNVILDGTPGAEYRKLVNSVKGAWHIYEISGEDEKTKFSNFIFQIVQNPGTEAQKALQKSWNDLVTLAKETSNRNIPQELINDWFKGRDIDAIRGDIQTIQGDFNEDLPVSISNSRRISEASDPARREETIDLRDTSPEDGRFEIVYALCEIANNPLMTGKSLMTPAALPAKEGLDQSTIRIDDESGLNQLFRDKTSYDSAEDRLGIDKQKLIEQIDKFNKVNKSAVTATTASAAAMAEPTTPAAATTTAPPAIAIQLSRDGTTITNLAELNASIAEIDSAQPDVEFFKKFERMMAPSLAERLSRGKLGRKEAPSADDIERYKKLRTNLEIKESPEFKKVKNALANYSASEESYQDLRGGILQAQLEMKWANDKMTIPVSLLGVRDDASIKALERDNIDMSVVRQKFETFLENALPIFDLPHAWRRAFVKSNSTEAGRNPTAKATLFLNSLFKELLVPHNSQDPKWLYTEALSAKDNIGDSRLAPNIALCGTLLGCFIDSGSTATVPEQIRKAFKTEHTYQNDIDITDYDDLVAITIALYNELKTNHPKQLGVLEQIHNLEDKRQDASPIVA